MGLMRYITAAVVGLGLMGMSAQAATVTILGGQSGAPGPAPNVNDPFAAGTDASFLLPNDYEIQINSTYDASVDMNGAMIDQNFVFLNTSGVGTVFDITIDTIDDFSGLTFTWSDNNNLRADIVAVGNIAALTVLVLPLAMVDYTLAVTGTLNLQGGNFAFGGYNISVSAVPIPGAAWLFGTALLGGGFVVSRRRKRRIAATAAA